MRGRPACRVVGPADEREDDDEQKHAAEACRREDRIAEVACEKHDRPYDPADHHADGVGEPTQREVFGGTQRFGADDACEDAKAQHVVAGKAKDKKRTADDPPERIEKREGQQDGGDAGEEHARYGGGADMPVEDRAVQQQKDAGESERYPDESLALVVKRERYADAKSEAEYD